MKRCSRNCLVYLVAGYSWSLGLMTFFVVYNLYLLDLGFHEEFIGRVSACMTLGSLAVSFPMSYWLNRFGVIPVIRTAVLLTCLSLIIRSLATTPSLLLTFAFLNGCAIGAWVISAPPFLAANTSADIRTRVFSWNYGGSVAMGILAGALVGLLPNFRNHAWFMQIFFGALSDRHPPLFTGAVFVGLASLILCFIRHNPESENPAQTKQSERVLPLHSLEDTPSSLLSFFRTLFTRHPATASHHLIRNLILVLVLWSLFSAGLPPFYNVFFLKRFQQTLSEIGLIFSLSQLCQALAMFLMPWFVLVAGRVRVITATQLLATGFLLLLSFARLPLWAGVNYLLYLSFQAMCEPALENFIMDSVSEKQRNLVSSIRYMILFFVQAIAVWGAGFLIQNYGFAWMLSLFSVAGAGAAWFFYRSFRGEELSY